jgi:hypothetical protein
MDVCDDGAGAWGGYDEGAGGAGGGGGARATPRECQTRCRRMPRSGGSPGVLPTSAHGVVQGACWHYMALQ